MSDSEKHAPLSFGEALVGVNFNPSQNAKVKRLKELFAEASDIVKQTELENSQTANPNLYKLIDDGAQQSILAAQMMAVKAVTLPGRING